MSYNSDNTSLDENKAINNPIVELIICLYI